MLSLQKLNVIAMDVQKTWNRFVVLSWFLS